MSDDRKGLTNEFIGNGDDGLFMRMSGLTQTRIELPASGIVSLGTHRGHIQHLSGTRVAHFTDGAFALNARPRLSVRRRNADVIGKGFGGAELGEVAG